MQEWMLAMLVISITLIIRDMAKTIWSGNVPDTQEMIALCDSHPQKERVEQYAASFRRLADTFYGMPYPRDYLSSGQIRQITEDTNEQVCARCYRREICWESRGKETVSGDRAAGPGTGKWKGRRNPTDSGGLDELLRAFRAVLPYSFSKFSAGENEPDMGQPYD